jgi:Tol biopolymer transport system component
LRRGTLLVSGLLAATLALSGCGGDEVAPSDLAFVSSRDGDYAIFVMAADGGGERRLTRADTGTDEAVLFFQIEPAWSPDGAKIAFTSRRSGTSDIYVMRADGTGTTRVTSTTEDDTHPTWSADGSKIAFARAGDIYAMAADGSNPVRITDIAAEESDPAWSPDGAWIAYVRRAPGTPVRDVWIMRPDGSERHALTRQPGRAFTPAWSPDSSRIVFSSNRSEARRVGKECM